MDMSYIPGFIGPAVDRRWVIFVRVVVLTEADGEEVTAVGVFALGFRCCAGDPGDEARPAGLVRFLL